MVTYEDTLGLCELSEGEVMAIAEHEHTAPIIASGIGSYLIQHHGEQIISQYILDDMVRAQKHGDYIHQIELQQILAQFLAEHPFQGTPH
ncbi:hypothetical protein [Oceanospirillum sediminis]|uniref:Uncharacterized protein n=1 Tax=Oceanospirillum sediminis TaxID=2760088 RepID=A0A839ISM6_9GAMM|nr:hypothetical protein [Oceanospirillum sediminis]MBB1487437.1 hypothetical protein [Oceanospirillum sediminis]